MSQDQERRGESIPDSQIRYGASQEADRQAQSETETEEMHAQSRLSGQGYEGKLNFMLRY